MPFISKDWRSPGEQWVKIGPGWERAKVLNYLHSSYFQNGEGNRDEAVQPQYNITTRTTKEIRRQNTLSEALLQLDFYSACHDVRKFNYACRMIQLLLCHMNYLPGNVQRILIKLIEEASSYARENGWKGEARNVLQTMKNNLQDPPVWGGQLGSTKLWDENRSQIQKILDSDSEEFDEVYKVFPMQGFPDEVIRQIVLKLNCDKDIEAMANANAILSKIADENRIWRELCNYHFTPQQIQQIHDHLLRVMKDNNGNHVRQFSRNHPWCRNRTSSSSQDESSESDSTSSDGLVNHTENSNDTDINNGNGQTALQQPHWKLKFKTLKRRYGLSKEDYADELNLCKSCGLLFWTAAHTTPHHDCGIPILIPVKPGDFIKYFCV